MFSCGFPLLSHHGAQAGVGARNVDCILVSSGWSKVGLEGVAYHGEECQRFQASDLELRKQPRGSSFGAAASGQQLPGNNLREATSGQQLRGTNFGAPTSGQQLRGSNVGAATSG